jgi:hypothetical protein
MKELERRRGLAQTKYAKQPRRGDVVDTGRYGRCDVERVHNHGLTLWVRDERGRNWMIERAPEGCWAVLSCATVKHED